jgi:hypothetical protein
MRLVMYQELEHCPQGGNFGNADGLCLVTP